MSGIQARCLRCYRDFRIFEVVAAQSGLCPSCGSSLTEDRTAVLLFNAAQADLAQRKLLGALRRLHSLPGTMVLLPSSVLGNVVNEVGWRFDLVEHDAVLADERRRLSTIADWARGADPLTRPSRRARLAGWLRLRRSRIGSARHQRRRHPS